MSKAVDILAKKSESSYTNKVNEIIETISYNTENSKAVGSFSFKNVGKYSADVDIFENFHVFAKNELHACKQIAAQIKQVIKQVKEKKDFWFSEFKAGIDERFKIGALGKLEDGKVVGFNKKQAIAHLVKLVDENLIDQEIGFELISLVKQPMTSEIYEQIDKIIREFYVLRWKQDEVLKGKKKLVGNKFMSLVDAISYKSIVKLDCITYMQSRFIECTNVMILTWVDKKGDIHYLNIVGDNLAAYLTKGMKMETKKISDPKSAHFSPMKLSKRIFAQAALKKDKAVVEKLIPLLTSDLALLYQVRADAEVIINMLTKLNSKLIKQLSPEILTELDEFRSRLAGVNLPIYDNAAVDDTISDIVLQGKNNNKQALIDKLNNLCEYITEILKTNVPKYLKKVGLFPVPKTFVVV